MRISSVCSLIFGTLIPVFGIAEEFDTPVVMSEPFQHRYKPEGFHHVLGGLSGLHADPRDPWRFFAVSDRQRRNTDDPERRNTDDPARIVEFRLIQDGEQITIGGWREHILDGDLKDKSLEAIAIRPDGEILITHERSGNDLAAEILRLRSDIARPQAGPERSSIVTLADEVETYQQSDNSGFESIAVLSNGDVVVAIEKPLRDEVDAGWIRVIRLNRDLTPSSIYKYKPNDFGTGHLGVSEMAHLEGDCLLILERDWNGVKTDRDRNLRAHNWIRIFRVELSVGTPIASERRPIQDLVPLSKGDPLVFGQTREWPWYPDNVEGMAIGPSLGLEENGQSRDTLLLVSDNNFKRRQRTNVILLEVPGLRDGC